MKNMHLIVYTLEQYALECLAIKEFKEHKDEKQQRIIVPINSVFDASYRSAVIKQ